MDFQGTLKQTLLLPGLGSLLVIWSLYCLPHSFPLSMDCLAPFPTAFSHLTVTAFVTKAVAWLGALITDFSTARCFISLHCYRCSRAVSKTLLPKQISPPQKCFRLVSLTSRTHFGKHKRHYRKQTPAANPGSNPTGYLGCALAAFGQILLVSAASSLEKYFGRRSWCVDTA